MFKKLISVLLLTTFLFNVAGYYLGYLILSYRARVELTAHLDAGNYSESEAITIKIPLPVPYFADQANYERVDGAFEHQGEFFKLVKQKLDRDTLYVVCIRDVREQTLFSIMSDFAKLSAGRLPTQQALKWIGSLIKDYVSPILALPQESFGFFLTLAFFPPTFGLLDRELQSFYPPPDGLA